MSLDALPKLLDTGRPQDLQPQPSYIMSGRCSSKSITRHRRVIPCLCVNGKYEVVSDHPSLTDIECLACGHDFSEHESGPEWMASMPSSSKFLQGQHPTAPPINPSPFAGLPDTYTERQGTVKALWKRIKEQQVVHIRGTPATGKSTLAYLLSRHVSTVEPDIVVYNLSWPVAFRELTESSHYHHLLNNLAGRPHDLNDWLSMNCLLVIDEAQGSYKYSSLWNDLIKFLEPGWGLRIALFSSYGSPSALVAEAATATPLIFGSKQRVSLKRSTENPDLCLLLSHEEFHDVVFRRCRSYSQPFFPSEELVAHIWDITQGHSAATAGVLSVLANSSELRPFRKAASVISLADALKFIKTDNFVKLLLEQGKFSRGLVSEGVLQKSPELVKFLQRVVSANRVSGDPSLGSPLGLCYHNGWLQAELVEDPRAYANESSNCNVYVFSSPLHQRCTEYLLPRPNEPFPRSKYSTVKDFSLSVLQRFSSVALRLEAPLGAGVVPRPLEAGFQDEFYRASFELLGNLYLQPEWTGTEKNGWVDFAVPSEKWIIECVRNGSKLQEHINRFQTNGKYHEWVRDGEVKEFILLDFRQSIPNTRRDIDWLYHIVFSGDFTSYTVLDSNCRVIRGQERIAC